MKLSQDKAIKRKHKTEGAHLPLRSLAEHQRHGLRGSKYECMDGDMYRFRSIQPRLPHY